MNENNNNINSTDNTINDTQTSLQTEKEENKSFDIRSFNSYAKEPEVKSEEVSTTNTYPSVENVPLIPTQEGTFYTPEPAPVPEASTEIPILPPDPATVAREYKKGAKSRFSYIAFMIILLNLVCSFAAAFAVVICEIVTQEELSATASMVISALSVALAGFPFMALTLSRIKITEKLPKKNISIGKLLAFFTVTVTAMYGGAFIGNAFGSVLGEIFGNEGEQLVSSSLEGVSIWVIIVFTCIFPGIFEELIFRKLIIDKTKEYGLFASVIFSGFTFGIFHGNFEQFFYALLVGLVFGYIYAKTGRIIYTIILHATMNFFGSALILLVEDSELATMMYGLIMMIIWIVGVIALVYEIVDNSKKLKNDTGIQAVGSGNAILSMMLNPGMIVFLIVFAIEFAYMTILTYGA